MEEELEILEYLYNIIKLEKDSIARIIKMRDKDDLLNKILKDQLIVYKKFNISVGRMIEIRKKKTAENIDNLSIFARIASHVGAKFVVANENDIDTIINILIKRYKICIDEVEGRLSEHKITSKTIKNLCNRFIEFENKNIQIINKNYLNKKV